MFFDIIAELGAHFNFGYNEYKELKQSELMELYVRFEKKCQQQQRQSTRGRW